jgi:hypothetical protein
MKKATTIAILLSALFVIAGSFIASEYMVTEIKSFSIEGNKITVEYFQPSNASYASMNGGEVPGKAWKEVYSCKDPLVLDTTIIGTHIPSSYNNERVEYPGGPRK